MSPLLTLALATTLANAEPTQDHAMILAAVVELHATLERSSSPASASAAQVDIAFRYDFARGARLASIAPASPDARPRVTYSLATPVFRDLL